MKNNWIRLIAGALVSVALVGIFALTGGMKGGRSTEGLLYQASGLHPDGEMLTISGQTVTCEEYLHWVDYVCQYFATRITDLDWNAQIESVDMSYGEYAKVEAAEMVKQYAVIRAWAQQEGVTLTEEDTAALDAQREEYVSYYGGEEGYQQQLALMGISEDTYNAMLETQYLYRELYQAFRTNGSSLYPEESVLSSYAAEQGYMSAYLVTVTGENAETMAADLLERWQKAEDKESEYAAICEELELSADGIITVSAVENDALSDAIAALATGEITAVNDPYGDGTCYLVLRSDTDLSAVAETYFDVLFEEKLNSAAVVTNSELYDALDVGAFYEKLTQLRTEMETAMEPDDAQSDAADTQDDAASADTQDDAAADDSAV